MHTQTRRNIPQAIIIALALVAHSGCGGGPLIKSIPIAPPETQREWGSVWDDWSGGWSQGANYTTEAGQVEEDAFGNIMEATFATIEDVTYRAISGGSISSGTSVAVSAKIILTDEEAKAAIRSVKLIYRMNGGARQSAAMAEDPGSNIFSGIIPGASSGTKVEFYIWMCDTNGNVSTGAFPSKDIFVSGVSDINNAPAFAVDSADITEIAASYDSENIYIGYKTQGNIDGGTVEPPYIMMYFVKVTNPDIEQGEGLLVGKWWISMPLAKTEEGVRMKLITIPFGQQAQTYIDKLGPEKMAYSYETGFMVLGINDMLAGNVTDGFIYDAKPEGYTYDNIFVGRLKRSALDQNPSGYLRLIIFTAANASLDSFMPIPLNCSNFLTLYTSNYSYSVN